jgi:diguanylate cyclase (GGDEF)-like protein
MRPNIVPMSRTQWSRWMAPWRHVDDGRVWFGIYASRMVLLLCFGAATALVNAFSVTTLILLVVVPYNFIAQRLHRDRGVAHRMLPVDQVLAALCVLLAPQALVGAVICMVATTTDTLGVPVRRVWGFAAAGSVTLLVAAALHRSPLIAAYVLPQFACSVATSNVISFLKNKRSASSERIENLLDGLHAFVYEADLESGDITFCNKQTIDRLGEVTNLSDMKSRLHPDDVEAVRRAFGKGAESLTPFTLEVRVTLDDATVHMEQRTTFANYRGRIRVRTVLFDVSARKRIELEMAHRAFHDSLTELPNRALFLDRLEHALDRAERTSAVHAVLLLDLDNFKDVNDGMGHQVGDELLVEIARRLNLVSRRTDTIARLGGDEFALLLEDTTPEAALRIGREVIDAVGMSYLNAEVTLFPRVSIGVATYPAHGTASSELLRHADMAMYHAKRRRMGVALFDETMNPSSAQKLTILAEFRTALAKNELEAYFQPVVDATTGRLSSCEALVRWNHPTLGVLAPAAFLPTICAGGLSADLARWMLADVIGRIGVWNKLGIAVPVAVNLSAVDVVDVELIDWLLAEMARCSVPAHLLTIELTEAELLDRSSRTIEMLTRLSASGITTAVDDFGTGYSSLVWLRDLPIDTLKIDRSFVDSMFTDERSETIVRSTIQMAQALQINIVGEGVEDNRTAATLRELGCDSLQGYLFSRPVRARDMLEILQAGGYPIDGPVLAASAV